MTRAIVILLAMGCAGSEVTQVKPPPADEPPKPASDAAPLARTQADAAIDAATPSRERPVFAVLHARPGIDVVESVNHASHMHGGSPASITHASLNVVVKDAGPHVVSVAKLELLHGHCHKTTWTKRDLLKVKGYEVHDWDAVDPVATGTTDVTLPHAPDLYSVYVQLATPALAYSACDRFAFAVKLVIDGTPLALEVPLDVTRYESLGDP